MKNCIRVQQFICAIFLFLLTQNIKTQDFEKDQSYQKYFQEQDKIYQSLVNLKIPGVRPLNIDKSLAESVLENCPEEVKEIISDIEHKLFSSNKKNTIFYGPSGTGKSAIAQAIAIKCQVPCLFFNVGTISTEYKDSGIQNLSKIFKYAQELEKNLGKPCIIIFDELEALTKKHANSHHAENNILVSFWQELDSMKNNNVIAIGTMNNTDDVPDQIINRTSMIKVPLPNLEQKTAIIDFHLKKRAAQYKLEYPEWLTPDYLALKTQKFSNRDLENLVEQATRSAIKAPIMSNKSTKIVLGNNFDHVINQIKKQRREKWIHAFKKCFHDSKIVLPVLGLVLGLNVAYNQIKSLALQEKSIAMQIANQKENIAMQEKNMKQAQDIAKYQTSFEHMAKQAKINSIPWWSSYSNYWMDTIYTSNNGFFNNTLESIMIKEIPIKSE